MSILKTFEQAVARIDLDQAVEIIDPSISHCLCQKIGNKLGKSEGQLWWWENNGYVTKRVAYESNGLSEIRDLLADETRQVFLFLTDDEFAPWPAVRGSLRDILVVLEDMHYFEFFLCDDSCEWVLFDTHHNELIVCDGLSRMTHRDC